MGLDEDEIRLAGYDGIRLNYDFVDDEIDTMLDESLKPTLNTCLLKNY